MTIRQWCSAMVLSEILAVSLPAQTTLDPGVSSPTPAMSRSLEQALAQLDSDVVSDPGLAALYALLLSRDYGIAQREIVWALDQGIFWSQIAVLSYVQATTGRSFEELVRDGAHTDGWAYAGRMEMSHERMARSLEGFVQQAVEERNSRIFDRLRATRRTQTLPDLGAGFGLFQESLDLRGLEAPDPVKIHTGSGFPAKGGTENE